MRCTTAKKAVNPTKGLSMNTDKLYWGSFGIEPIDPCVDICLSDIQDPTKYPINQGISTGYCNLDEATSGIAPKSFNVIAGRPLMGTTSLALSICLNVAVNQKKPIAIFSLTQDKYLVTKRLLSLKSGVKYEQINRHDLNENDKIKIAAAADEIKSSPVLIDDGAFSIRAIKKKIEDYIEIDFKPAIVLIDDLSELANIKNTKQVLKIVKQIKKLIQETEVAVILTSRLLRKLEKRITKFPMMADVPTGLRHPHPDLLLLLYREDYYKPHPIDKRHKTQIIIANNRHGITGLTYLEFNCGIFT